MHINNVSAGRCCSWYNSDCCGKCIGGTFDGQECSLYGSGSPHDLDCGYCNSKVDDGGCGSIGWKC